MLSYLICLLFCPKGGEEKTMDWMYKGPSALVNREDYLLGRKIDKSLQLLEEAEKGNTNTWLSEAEKGEL
jgi:hypothetical protein